VGRVNPCRHFCKLLLPFSPVTSFPVFSLGSRRNRYGACKTDIQKHLSREHRREDEIKAAVEFIGRVRDELPQYTLTEECRVVELLDFRVQYTDKQHWTPCFYMPAEWGIAPQEIFGDFYISPTSVEGHAWSRHGWSIGNRKPCVTPGDTNRPGPRAWSPRWSTPCPVGFDSPPPPRCARPGGSPPRPR